MTGSIKGPGEAENTSSTEGTGQSDPTKRANQSSDEMKETSLSARSAKTRPIPPPKPHHLRPSQKEGPYSALPNPENYPQKESSPYDEIPFSRDVATDTKYEGMPSQPQEYASMPSISNSGIYGQAVSVPPAATPSKIGRAVPKTNNPLGLSKPPTRGAEQLNKLIDNLYEDLNQRIKTLEDKKQKLNDKLKQQMKEDPLSSRQRKSGHDINPFASDKYDHVKIPDAVATNEEIKKIQSQIDELKEKIRLSKEK